MKCIYVCGVEHEGRGGWAYIANDRESRTEQCGTELALTTNRMEIRAAIIALSSLAVPTTVTVVSHSQYLVKSMNGWLDGWIAAGWCKAHGNPVANRDLWEHLMASANMHNVTWIWIASSSGHPMSVRCSILAQEQAGIAEGVQTSLHRVCAIRTERRTKLRALAASELVARNAIVDRITTQTETIRARWADGEGYQALAKVYRVPKSLIRSVVKGHSLDEWAKHLPPMHLRHG